MYVFHASLQTADGEAGEISTTVRVHLLLCMLL